MAADLDQSSSFESTSSDAMPEAFVIDTVWFPVRDPTQDRKLSDAEQPEHVSSLPIDRPSVPLYLRVWPTRGVSPG